MRYSLKTNTSSLFVPCLVNIQSPISNLFLFDWMKIGASSSNQDNLNDIMIIMIIFSN